MGSAALLDSVWRLLANDATFLGFRGWFNKAVLNAGASAGATSIQVTSTISYVNGEQLQIGTVTTTVTQTGTGMIIPVTALSALVASGAQVQSLLAPSSAVADKVAYIVKEEETESIVTGTSIPIVLIYTRPGKPDARSSRVYIGKVVIDCFAKDGNTARKMVDQTVKLMQNWNPDAAMALVSLFAYDTSFKTGISGVKGHRVFYDVSSYVG